MSTPGKLFVVATPIGNLQDMSVRAQEILAHVDIVLAERPSVSRGLLTHFNIHPPEIFPYQDQNEQKMSLRVVEWLAAGKNIALISDAGTPLISDPGYRLVSAVHEAGFSISPIPGASACIAALSVSGIGVDSFLFSGFLPPKSKARIDKLQEHDKLGVTLIYYESVHRIQASLSDIALAMGSTRQVAIARELTKKFESVHNGQVGELAKKLGSEIPLKGEWVIIISARKKVDEQNLLISNLANDLMEKLSVRDVASILSRHFAVSRNKLYDQLISHKKNTDNLD